MQDTKHHLRNQLRDTAPELYASLMHSWEIAEREWFSAMPSEKGSFNSLPHIKNVERYANEILAQVDGTNPFYDIVLLSPCEKYCLLASILLHDIGRTNLESKKEHGEKSKIILDESYANVGIDNERLAKIIGEICCYHTCTKEEKERLSLEDCDIAPYGLIRVKRLAVLLAFCDELDSSYTRAYPSYLSPNPQGKEGFRRATSNIRANVASMTVVACVDVNNVNIEKTKITVDWNGVYLEPNFDHCSKEQQDIISPYRKNEKEWKAFCSEISKVLAQPSLSPKVPACMCDDLTKIYDAINELVMKRNKGFTFIRNQFLDDINPFQPLESRKDSLITNETQSLCDSILGYLDNLYNNTELLKPPILSEYSQRDYWGNELPCCVLLGLGRFTDDLKETNLKKIVNFTSLAASVLTSAVKLDALKKDLSLYGLPFRAWVLEYKEHLFTWYGRETYEASLSTDFLLEIVERMWQLSAGIFGHEPCKYETLAAKLRVEDIERVKIAVRRIAIVMRHKDEFIDKETGEKKSMVDHVIRYSDSAWWWEIRKGDCLPHDHHGFKYICETIKKLADPLFKDPFNPEQGK